MMLITNIECRIETFKLALFKNLFIYQKVRGKYWQKQEYGQETRLL